MDNTGVILAHAKISTVPAVQQARKNHEENPTAETLDHLLVTTKLAHTEAITQGMPHTVHIIESERGWGQKVDDEIECHTLEEARAFVIQFNEEQRKKSPSPADGSAPDWYCFARYEGRVS